MLNLDIEQLKTFLAVVDTESFTQAAERVAKTQSAVSMQIKKLEDTLGKKLFDRVGRGIVLNTDGSRLVGYARDIVQRSNEAVAAFNDKVLRGKVYLGTADDYADRFLPPIIAGFSEIHPMVELSVVCENTSNLARRTRSGELDVAIVTHNEVKEHSELVREEPHYWVCSSHHSIHKNRVLPLALDSCGRFSATDILDSAGLEHRLLCTSASSRVVGSAVLAGLAISVQPESALRPGMRVLTEKDGFPPLPDCQIGLIRGIREKTEVTEALVSLIRQSLGDKAWPNYAEGKRLVDVERIGRPERALQQRASV